MIAQRQYEDKTFGDWYNVGPDECDCVTTGDLVDLFCTTWGDNAKWINQAEDNAPHEANFLKLDCSKLKSVFGWKPRWHIDEAVEKTIEWTKVWMRQGDVPACMDAQIQNYFGG